MVYILPISVSVAYPHRMDDIAIQPCTYLLLIYVLDLLIVSANSCSGFPETIPLTTNLIILPFSSWPRLFSRSTYKESKYSLFLTFLISERNKKDSYE